MNKRISRCMNSIFAMLILCCSINSALAQTRAFTYQGRLSDAGFPANGNYDFQLSLFDTVNGGGQIGRPVFSNIIAGC